MLGWIAAAALLLAGLLRVFAGYPRPARPCTVLSRREAALLSAAGEATFPPGGAIAPSGRDAGVAAYADRWLSAMHPRQRRLVRALLFLVEHATLLFPAPGASGFRRFSVLSLAQRQAALEGWRRSRLYPRRVVFVSLRAILTMAYFAYPPVLRQLGLAPLAIESPVCEADLLYPPIGRGPEAIPFSAADPTPPGEAPPLAPGGPLHPDYAGGAR